MQRLTKLLVKNQVHAMAARVVNLTVNFVRSRDNDGYFKMR